MSNPSLLPSNRTPLEQAFEGVIAKHTNIDARIGDLWNPDTCPAQVIKYLAWALGVDLWDEALSVQTRRDVLRASVQTHATKGTVSSVHQLLEAFGYPDAEVIDWHTAARLDDGGALDDGHRLHTLEHWADYEIVVDGQISAQSAAQLASILNTTAPAHCRLVRITATIVVALSDGHMLDDGSALNATYSFEDQ